MSSNACEYTLKRTSLLSLLSGPASVRVGIAFLLAFACLSVAGTQVRAEETKELVTEDELKLLRTSNPQYIKALGSTSLNQTETNLIKEFMRLNVLSMSLKSNERLLPEIREKLKREIDLRAKPAPRDVMLQEIVKNSKLLLNHPMPVKLNAVILLTELNENSGEITKDIPPTPYQGMVEPLLEVINDPNQHEALKVAAANGLLRLCRDSSPKVDVRMRIADALVKQLDRTDTTNWYRMVAIQALCRTDVINDASRKPFVVQKLAEILVDPKQGWRVRADAAFALGRVPMDNTINVQLIVHEIARFAHEVSVQYNKSKTQPHWRYCMLRIYLAFRPEDAKDSSLLVQAGKSPVNKYRTEIQAAYDLILPLVNGVLEFNPPQALAKGKIDDLQGWIDSNRPANLSVSLDPNVKVKPLRTAG